MKHFRGDVSYRLRAVGEAESKDEGDNRCDPCLSETLYSHAKRSLIVKERTLPLDMEKRWGHINS